MAELLARRRRARLTTVECLVGFVLCDIVGARSQSHQDISYVIGAFGGSAFFLATIAAAVWWAWISSTMRSRSLDARLDEEAADAGTEEAPEDPTSLSHRRGW